MLFKMFRPQSEGFSIIFNIMIKFCFYELYLQNYDCILCGCKIMVVLHVVANYDRVLCSCKIMIVLHVVANYDRILCGCKIMIVFYEFANYDHINIINQRFW